jgi:hypothetical protein
VRYVESVSWRVEVVVEVEVEEFTELVVVFKAVAFIELSFRVIKWGIAFRKLRTLSVPTLM